MKINVICTVSLAAQLCFLSDALVIYAYTIILRTDDVVYLVEWSLIVGVFTFRKATIQCLQVNGLTESKYWFIYLLECLLTNVAMLSPSDELRKCVLILYKWQNYCISVTLLLLSRSCYADYVKDYG